MPESDATLAARAEQLAVVARDLADRVDRLDEQLKDSQRRGLWLIALGVLVAASVAVSLHDEHIEHCTPPRPDYQVFGFISEKTLCDWSFPLHDHPYEEESP